MKKIVYLLLSVLVVSLVACSPKKEDKSVGGWQLSDSPEITEEIKTSFEKALDKLTGATYTPVACVATQVVSGINYRILCRCVKTVKNPVETYAFVEYYQDLEGNVELKDIYDTEVETNINELSGGWRQSESPVVTDELKKAFDQAVETLTGTEYTPVAFTASQVVAGENYCFLCISKNVVPDATEGYAFVEVYKNLEGKSEIKDIKEVKTES